MLPMTRCYRPSFCLLPAKFGRRHFAVDAKIFEFLEKFDFKERKIHQRIPVPFLSDRTIIPLDAPWQNPNSTKIFPVPPGSELLQDVAAQTPTCVSYGGLSALMHVAELLEQLNQMGDYTTTVTYFNDGLIPKVVQSGGQGHVHPSEWGAKICDYTELFKTMLRGMHLMRELDPAVEDYNYLHFPWEWRDLSRQVNSLGLYGRFFMEKVKHTLNSKDGLSKQDYWLCRNITKSLDVHEKYDKDIRREFGERTFARGFRMYWSTDQKGIDEKRRQWTALGIPTEIATEKEILKYTLLKPSAIKALKVIGDGRFFPNTPPLIIKYLQHKYPKQFIYQTAVISEIYYNHESLFCYAKNDRSGEKRLIKANTIFGSPGHNEVFRYAPIEEVWHKTWDDVPVTGVSSIWVVKIKKQELAERFGNADMDDQEIRRHIGEMVAVANLSNLHFTPLDYIINGDTVELFGRGTQGAHFNETYAFKGDALNMAHNLNRHFVGDYDVASLGSCTRRSGVRNIPEFVALSSKCGFVHGQSGVGYSYSATPYADLTPP